MFEDVSVWMQGQNLIGYLPNSGPSIYLDWESAKDSLLYDLGDNGLSDYFVQGVNDHWLSILNGQGGEITLAIMEYVKDHHPNDYDDMSFDSISHLMECEEAIQTVKELEPSELVNVSVGYTSLWIDYAPSLKDMLKEGDIDPDEFESAEDALDALNEAMMV